MSNLTNKPVFIVGPKRTEHELMCAFLERETGFSCKTSGNGQQVGLPPQEGAVGSRLILWDCLGRDMEECLKQFEDDSEHWSAKDIVALFNVRANMGIEEEALGLGVRGFFYETDALDCLAKGVKSLFNGELWISRDVSAKIIMRKGIIRKERPQKSINGLTQREVEILKLVAVGETNEEIAQELNISPHTVRTHLHNIFKKIQVPNRLQAALWVADRL